jgi:hypothetical protein
MTNYAAAPIQPIVNGIITVDGESGIPGFVGRGISSIARTVGGAAFGDYTLILDQGLPGDVGLVSDFARTMLTQRSNPAAVLPGGTSITQQAITYPTTATLRIVISIASVGTDPDVALELVVWRTN